MAECGKKKKGNVKRHKGEILMFLLRYFRKKYSFISLSRTEEF